jgi:hypothetical protein
MTMAYSRRNRCGDVYWLQRAKTGTGKLRYYFARKLTGEPVEEVPAGFEAYESPRYGQLYLRKKLLTCIDPEERAIVADGISLFSEVSHFIVDIEEDCLVVYVPSLSDDRLDSMIRRLAGPDALQVPRYREAREQFVRESEHEKALRFQLLDVKQRLFLAERWDARDEYGDWIYLGGPAALLGLVDEFVERLGKETFHELY